MCVRVHVSPLPRLKRCSDSRSFWTESPTSRETTGPRLSWPQSPKRLISRACLREQKRNSLRSVNQSFRRARYSHRRGDVSLIHCVPPVILGNPVRSSESSFTETQLVKVGAASLWLSTARSVCVCAWRCATPANVCPPTEEGQRLPHHVGMFALSGREKRVLVSVFLLASFHFLLLISMQTSERRAAVAMVAECLIHRLGTSRGIWIDEQISLASRGHSLTIVTSILNVVRNGIWPSNMLWAPGLCRKSPVIRLEV